MSASGPHAVVEFAAATGATPLGIAAAPDGNVWFTQNLRGNIARITQDGRQPQAALTGVNLWLGPTPEKSVYAAAFTRTYYARSSVKGASA